MNTVLFLFRKTEISLDPINMGKLLKPVLMSGPISSQLPKDINPGIFPLLFFFIQLHSSFWIIPINTQYVHLKTNKEANKPTYFSQHTSSN